MRSIRWFLVLLACAFATNATAEYPERPIRLIVPQAPGSATDTLARIVAAEVNKEISQQIIVDNRPGGALTLGLDLTAKSEPDGYTICMGPIGALAITRHMVAKLPYDIERDFQPVALVTRGHLLLAVTSSLPVKSVQELIDYAKKNPGKLSNASSSAMRSTGHVGGELFKYMTGTEIVHIPYRGGAAALNDLISGQVHLMFESLNSIAPHARSNTIRALAVSGARRSPGFPELPTVGETVPGYEAATWSGVIAPSGVPKPIIARLNALINKAIASKSFQERFAMIGDEPAGGTPEEFGVLIKKTPQNGPTW
jgi:tripartite-type tricarboxylate transporter receptor subunit TctC